MSQPPSLSSQMLWTEPQQKEFSKLNDSVRRAREFLEKAEETEASKPITYVKQRATTSLSYHQRELENLENLFRLKKQEHLDKIKLAEEILSSVPPVIARLRVELNYALKKRDDFVQLINSFNTGQEEVQSSRRVVTQELPSERLAREEEARRLLAAERYEQQRRQQEEADLKRQDEQRQKELLERESSPEVQKSVEKSDSEEQEDNPWDVSGMSEAFIPRYLASRQKQGETIPPHLLHYLGTPAAEKKPVPESPVVPPPAKPKKSVKMPARKAEKEIGQGVVLYSKPLIDD